MAKRSSEIIWVVVEVLAGVPASGRAFRSKHGATRFERNLRRRMNPEKEASAVYGLMLPGLRG